MYKLRVSNKKATAPTVTFTITNCFCIFEPAFAFRVYTVIISQHDTMCQYEKYRNPIFCNKICKA